VVLVHGLGASLAFWYPAVAATLACTRRVLLFDLRGHGRSAMTPTGYTPGELAADLAALLAAHDVGAAHLVGHSYGGSVALSYALQHARLVQSLTIADARIRALQPADPPAAIGPQYGRGLPLRIEGDPDPTGAPVGIEWLTRMAQARLGGGDRVRGLVLPSPFMGMAGKAAALRWLALVNETSLRSDIAEPETNAVAEIAACRFPVLLVYGERSHARRSAAAFIEACRIARLHIVRGAGHFFPLTRPDGLLAPLQNFLADACTLSEPGHAAAIDA
jgi:pimeloyl-ACP methyl ester carboxylesterase